MKNNIDIIKEIDLSQINYSQFSGFFTGCIILTKNKKILLQKRGDDFYTYPGYLSTFGGKIEDNEQPIDAIIRELKEELEVNVYKDELIFLGAVTEKISGYTELIYEYFWHDKNGILTDVCNEGSQKLFSTYNEILAYPKLLDDITWIINKISKFKVI